MPLDFKNCGSDTKLLQTQGRVQNFVIVPIKGNNIMPGIFKQAFFLIVYLFCQTLDIK